MSPIIIVISELLPLISRLVTEIMKIKTLSEEDKDMLRQSVVDMRQKVSSIRWEN